MCRDSRTDNYYRGKARAKTREGRDEMGNRGRRRMIERKRKKMIEKERERERERNGEGRMTEIAR